jgi:hypothetical protein
MVERFVTDNFSTQGYVEFSILYILDGFGPFDTQQIVVR